MVHQRRKLGTHKSMGTWLRMFALGCVVALISSAVLPASAATGKYIANNTSKLVATAKNLGPADSAETIDISMWLNIADRGKLDRLVGQLYDPTSSHYRDWLKPTDIVNEFAPSAEDVRTVEQFLTSHNLVPVRVGPANLFVRARGTVADVEKAFLVQINKYDVQGTTYRANASDPYVEGPAAALTSAVYGMDNLAYRHPLLTRAALNQNSPSTLAATGDSTFATTDCFTGKRTETYTTDGSIPIATYTGNGYTDNIIGCGYTPQEIHTAYNLTGLYSEGFDGKGQTIVIIDWCGSPTIMNDANAFSTRFGLPPLTSSNFHILYSFTVPTCGAPDPEINIDVEWAHAIAPGANIDLVVPPSASFMDVDEGELYAIANGLGNIISGSYGSEELYTPTAELNEENLINEIAAATGISANFSSGDSGDYTFDLIGLPASVSAPADSPYATAVGGVSLALESNNTIAWQAGWGTNENLLISSGAISDPPTNEAFFFGGSGGGPSAVFSKPAFQNKLGGTRRLLPDISWLADPFTGGIIAITLPFYSPPLQWTVYGGTSLAAPMFSGLWAIANQEAGKALGQAARHLYSMPAAAILDVVPVGSSSNVTATIQDATGTTTYTAVQLAGLEGYFFTNRFYSALWDFPLSEDTTYVVTFGTDSGLMTAPGWDDVTGLGVPNSKAFADFFKPK
ncbi:MAG TPA: S53 family peptidase [Terriglobales bacterium]|nr:S53 family peptidase [Terriglobales bacterium]